MTTLETTKIPSDYLGEYGADSYGDPPLPSYLETMIDRLHTELSAGRALQARINIRDGDLVYEIMLDEHGLLVTQKLNGNSEDTSVPIERFSAKGGIRDLLATMVENGGLPVNADPADIQFDGG